MSINRIRILTPVIFWLFQFAVHIIRNIYRIVDNSFLSVLNPIFITYPLDIITFITFYFFFAPKFNKKIDVNLYIFLSVLYVHAYGFVWIFTYYMLGLEDISKLKVYYLSSIGHSLLYAMYGVITRLAIEWFENREKSKELEKQNVKTELAFLRSQINPHFLFNVLNNVNSFVIKNPNKASFAIIKLSDIMRYMLYEAKESKVEFIKEIDYIENYLTLQKLRYKTHEFINFKYDYDLGTTKFPPMLFIPFIENAFKHGVKNQGEINISISLKNNMVLFECKNRIRGLTETEKEQPGGIGIENVKRRLELLFPERNKLTINKADGIYSVKLKIEL